MEISEKCFSPGFPYSLAWYKVLLNGSVICEVLAVCKVYHICYWQRYCMFKVTSQRIKCCSEMVQAGHSTLLSVVFVLYRKTRVTGFIKHYKWYRKSSNIIYRVFKKMDPIEISVYLWPWTVHESNSYHLKGQCIKFQMITALWSLLTASLNHL